MGLMTTAWWPHNQNLPPPGAHTPAIVALSLVQLYVVLSQYLDLLESTCGLGYGFKYIHLLLRVHTS